MGTEVIARFGKTCFIILLSVLVFSNLQAVEDGNTAPNILLNESYPPVFTKGREYGEDDDWIGTYVFHWFNESSGQDQGPWMPLEGRDQWTGKVPFWRAQIKDIMDANIDVIFLHMWNGFHEEREQFFKAYQELRSEGYDTPALAPFLDPQLIWAENGTGTPLDLTSAAAKDEYVGWYELWFEQYFRYNSDDHAHTYLLHQDGDLVLNTGQADTDAINNLSALTRGDVEARLLASFGELIPALHNGIYQIGPGDGARPAFSDELAHHFSPISTTPAYSSYIEHNGRRTATLSPGFWDQNVSNPGIFLPRDGGSKYRQAWIEFLNTMDGDDESPPIHHLFIYSWNGYDQGTGIFEAVTDQPFIAPGNSSGNDDIFSDEQNPRHYIDTTHGLAYWFNEYRDLHSRVIYSDFPLSMKPGETASVKILTRNEGNTKWSLNTGIEGLVESTPYKWGPWIQRIDAAANEVDKYGGVFRGRPVSFEFEITALETPGIHHVTHAISRVPMVPIGFGSFATIVVGQDEVRPAHSGAYYDPFRDGEGTYVEVLNENQAIVYTFTYRPDRTGPAWFIGVGEIDGGSIVIDDLLRPTGTSFGSEFDTSDISFDSTGNMSMSFVDCEVSDQDSSVSYSGKEALGFSSWGARFERLSEIIGCDGNQHANAWRSGSYFDPERDGEGIVVEWLSNGQVLVIMFTYDLEGRQFWMLGTGEGDDDVIEMDVIYPSTPTGWGNDFRSDEIVFSDWGSFRLTWTAGCDELTFAYTARIPGFGSAVRNYKRLSSLAGTSCP